MTGLTACRAGCACAAFVSDADQPALEFRCSAVRNGCKGSALHAAARGGDLQAAQELLATAPEAAAALDELGGLPLHAAAAAANGNLVELLLEQPGAAAAINQRNLYGLTPLHVVCLRPEEASIGVLRQLLDAGADVDAPTLPEDDTNLEVLAGDTPLILAAQHALPTLSAAPFVAALLAAGSDPLLPSAHLGTSALEFACAAGDAEVVRLLLEAAPASPLYCKEECFCINYCLRLAVAYEHAEVAALLLSPPPSIHSILLQTAPAPDPTSVLHDEGSSLSAEEASFQAACAESADVFEPIVLEASLADAARLGNLDLVRLLVAAGANGSCCTASARVFAGFHQRYMRHLAYEDRFPRLHELDSHHEFYDTPLILALTHKHDHVAVWLLKRVNPSPVSDALGRLPVHWACLQGQLDLLQRMLETGEYRQRGRDGQRLIDRRDTRQWSPLAIALHYRNMEAVQLLLAHGASVEDTVNNKFVEGCLPPLHAVLCAELDGEEEEGHGILRALLQHGAVVDSLALRLAAKLGNEEVMDLLLASCNSEASEAESCH